MIPFGYLNSMTLITKVVEKKRKKKPKPQTPFTQHYYFLTLPNPSAKMNRRYGFPFQISTDRWLERASGTASTSWAT